MRHIQKGPEPSSLTHYRSQPTATYEGYPNKQDIRDALTREQRGLCCYCQARIKPAVGDMKIEHWESQTNTATKHRQLDYRNLLGACLGGEGKPKAQQHCDTHKGDHSLSFNPSDPTRDIERTIHYTGDGVIYSDDPRIDAELREILNLNLAQLKNNRKAVLSGFLQGFRPGVQIDVHRELPRWDGSLTGNLEPYSQVVVYYLRKRIRRGGP